MNTSSNKVALMATLHCLTGCAVGEVLGMLVSSLLGLNTIASVLLATGMAFLFGYGFSTLPLLRSGLNAKKAFSLVVAADTLSIATMEIVDNAFMVAIPGALHAGLDSPLFWASMAISLVAAFIAAFPVNKYLIGKGLGHAITHAHHHSNHHSH